MPRFVVMHKGEPYDFKGEDGRQIKGVTVHGFDPDDNDGHGWFPVKLSQREAELFPRAGALYEVEYGIRIRNGKREQLITSAVYLENWYPVEADKPVLKRAQ